MKGFALISLILMLLLSTTGCSSGRSTNNNANTAAKANSTARNSDDPTQGANDNVEALRNLIRIPIDPEEVIWRAFPDGPKGRYLIAVLHLLPEDAGAFTHRIRNAGPGDRVQVNIEQWYPAELVAMSEMNGEAAVFGHAYPATDFVQPPYNNGKVILIPDTGFVILELTER